MTWATAALAWRAWWLAEHPDMLSVWHERWRTFFVRLIGWLLGVTEHVPTL